MAETIHSFDALESPSMAYQTSDRNGNFLVKFRYGGREYTRSLNTKDPGLAQAGLHRIEETLTRLKRGWLELPAGADPGTFITSGGQLAAKPTLNRHETTEEAGATAERATTIQQLFDAYDAALPAGAKEPNTLLTERIHRNHITKILGAETLISAIELGRAQEYVSRRTKEKWRDRLVSSDTARKELKTLRAIWCWGHKHQHLPACPWELRDLRFAKGQGREPFRTYEEIRRRIERGGMDDAAQKRLWETLYLTSRDLNEVLAHTKAKGTASFVYPMMVFAACTGARRSELCRSKIDDFDFPNSVVHIREKKRDKSKTETSRIVDMNKLLIDTMNNWLSNHPGGQFTLGQADGSPVSIHLASEHFNRTLESSKKWKVIPGFHTLRHSFASILACKGVDQRIIDAYMGHQTDEMRKRYQHLFPKTRRRAVDELL